MSTPIDPKDLEAEVIKIVDKVLKDRGVILQSTNLYIKSLIDGGSILTNPQNKTPVVVQEKPTGDNAHEQWRLEIVN